MNAYKTLIITLYTLAYPPYLHLDGQVHWGLGLVIAIGGMIGARLAASLTVSRRGELWVKVMMAIIILHTADGSQALGLRLILGHSVAAMAVRNQVWAYTPDMASSPLSQR